MIYLDNASTTAIDPEVLESMMPYLKDQYGNAGTTYSLGRNAKKAIDIAREQVAELIGASPEQIIFTSGGSEANNLVFNSARYLLKDLKKMKIAHTNSEHDSVLRSIENLCLKAGFNNEVIPVYKDSLHEIGALNCEILETKLRGDPDIGFVSAMYVNNETGAESDIFRIGEMCKERGVLFHTDCVQALCTHPIDVRKIDCDFMSLSGHKIHAPKGVGALYVKHKNEVTPLICGGGAQEFGLRGGTENVASIVGLGKAAEILKQELHDVDVLVSVLKQRFFNGLKSALGNHEGILHVNGNIFQHGKILNVRFDGIESETLMYMLDAQGIYVSSGSACRSHESRPSRTLLDMGLSEDEARSSVRISLSKNNTHEEVGYAAERMAECVIMLKEA